MIWSGYIFWLKSVLKNVGELSHVVNGNVKNKKSWFAFIYI